MLYGTLLLTLVAVFNGTEFGLPTDRNYVVSLLYLSVVGSIIAFGMYLRLLASIGPERAAYSAMLIPVVALGISTVFEGYAWTVPALVGLGLIGIGNMLVLRSQKSTR